MSWIVKISKLARADLDYFRAHDNTAYLDCYRLSESISDDPFSGPGKPLQIDGFDGKVWCRRTSIEDLLVYEVFDNSVAIASFRTHLD